MSRHTRALRVVFPDAPDRTDATQRIRELEAELSAYRAQSRELRHSMIPQVIVTLTPSHDALQAELPGANGMRRVVPLGGRKAHISQLIADIISLTNCDEKQTNKLRGKLNEFLHQDDRIEETLLRILLSQSRHAVECGEDGSPTIAQVRHWERHSEFPDERCKFCKAEGRTFRGGRAKPVMHSVGDGSVTVRRIAHKGNKLSNSIRQSAEELGL